MSDSVLEDSYNLLEYLSAVSREVGPAPTRNVQEHSPVIWPTDLPEHPAISFATAQNDSVRLHIQRLPAPPGLDVPKNLHHVLGQKEITDPTRPVELRHQDLLALVSSEADRRFGARNGSESSERDDWESARGSELLQAFTEWKESTYTKWAKTTLPIYKTREIYRKLHELKHDMVSDSATHEVVWGELVLTYLTGDALKKDAIRSPLLSTAVSLQIDPEDASISVVAERPFELELDAVEGTDLPGLNILNDIKAELREAPPTLVTPEEREGMRLKLVAPLGVNADLVTLTKPVDISSAPLLNDGWVLFKRPRPLRQERFYDELAHKIRDESFVPEALASIVADNDSVDQTLRDLGSIPQTNDRTADRLMMPLPSNREQERIARQLATARGVTVQGPPGTGKSHTIVNLLSHLVAQGKRVLVTAEKEQALSVLRDKIPAELRNLAVSVLGSTPDALEELKSSVQSTQDVLSSIDTDEERPRIEELESHVDELRLELRGIDSALVKALASEESRYALPVGSVRAPDVAGWLKEEARTFAVPDALDPQAVFPLQRSAYDELLKTLQQVSAEDAAASLEHLPTETWIPSEEAFRASVERLHHLRSRVTSLEDLGVRLEAFESRNRDDLRHEADGLRKAAGVSESLKGPWQDQFGQALRDGHPLAQWVLQNHPQVAEKLEEAQRLNQHLVGTDVVVSVGDPINQLNHLKMWADRLRAGKKIGVFAPRELKELQSSVTVNGHPITTPEQVDLVAWQVRLRAALAELHRVMTQTYGQAQIPVPPEEQLLFQGPVLTHSVDKLRAWWQDDKPAIEERLASLTQEPRPTATSEALLHAAQLVEDVAVRIEERELTAELEQLDEKLTEASGVSGASGLWRDLLRARQALDAGGWTKTMDEAHRLNSVRSRVVTYQEHLQAIRDAGAEAWARALLEARISGPPAPSYDDATHGWEWAKARTWLTQLHTDTDIAALMDRSHAVAAELEATIVEAAGRSAQVELKVNMKDRQRRALDEWLSAVKRIGKGTGKNAPRFRAAAREALPEAMGAMPVWIMPIHRVLENFDPRVSDLFDVVIVDESSQCDLLTLGVLALGKKSVVVGDDKQTSPERVGVRADRIAALQDQHLKGMKGAKLLTLDESLYSLAGRAFPSTIALKEHFRSVPDIIDFSNRYYGGEIRPLREVTEPQLGAPLKVVHVSKAESFKIGSNRVNHDEAAALADQVAACVHDSAYDGLTFGVVSMMSGPQSQHLQDLIRERIGDEEFQNRSLRVGTPPHFQGDERNVVFISMVAHDNSFAFTRPQHSRWMNVAASRAQDQLWVFHSMDPGTLHHEDQRRELIYYAQGRSTPEQTKGLFELTDSKFERDVLQDLLDHGYEVTPQHRVGQYRIDFVVSVGAGERIAVECDGDSFHGPEHWDNDVRRQRVLERIGWTFWRVRASQYYYDRDAAMQPLWNILGKMEERVRERAAWEERERMRLARLQVEAAREGELSDDELVETAYI